MDRTVCLTSCTVLWFSQMTNWTCGLAGRHWMCLCDRHVGTYKSSLLAPLHGDLYFAHKSEQWGACTALSVCALQTRAPCETH